MVIIVHGLLVSPPVRAVQLVCDLLGVKYELKICNVLAGENETPEYLEMNPLHTIPTIQDGDFVLFESHAIAAYLANTYGKDDSYYPKDLKKRAVVDTRLHFNNTHLFTRLRDYLEPILRKWPGSSFDPDKERRLADALVLLDKLLGDSQWVAGTAGPTIADCCCASTVCTIVTILPSAPVPPRVAAWLKRCEQTLPNYEKANKLGAQQLQQILLSKYVVSMFKHGPLPYFRNSEFIPCGVSGGALRVLVSVSYLDDLEKTFTVEDVEKLYKKYLEEISVHGVTNTIVRVEEEPYFKGSDLSLLLAVDFRR